ncbi:TPA_asm: G [Artemisia betacytorhabdovirus 1]|nr:TPA_asm: G [Artemisia betacytorhabdovirus 1]
MFKMIHSYYIFIFITVVFGSLMMSSSDVITAPTFYECDDNSSPYSSGHCIDDCKGIFQLSEPIDVMLFKSSIIENIKIGTCKHIERKTELTKTWTFSTLPPTITKINKEVSKEGCLFHWDKECHSGECSTREPRIPDDYNWASTSVFVDNYWLIDVSRRAAILKIGGVTQIMTKTGLVDYREGYMLSTDKKSAEIWVPEDHEPSLCDLSPEKKIKCFNTTKQDNILCPKLGLELKLSKKFFHDGCFEGFHIDDSFIFQLESKSNPLIPSDHQVTDEFDPLWITVNSLKTKIEYQESLDCFSKCMTINGMKTGGVLSIFGKIIKNVGGGNFTSCHVEPTCNIKVPLIKCKGTDLIQVSCSNHMRWWNHTNGMELRDDLCVPGDIFLNDTVISSGHENIIINSSGYFWEPSSLSPHDRLEIYDHHSTIVLSTLANRDHETRGSNHTAFAYGGGVLINRDWKNLDWSWIYNIYWKVMLFGSLILVMIVFMLIQHVNKKKEFRLTPSHVSVTREEEPLHEIGERYIHE